MTEQDRQPVAFEKGEFSPGFRAAAYGVHLFTATGLIFAVLAAIEITRPQTNPKLFFLWLAIAFVIDSVDGPLARRFHVKTLAPRIDGRTMDDIIDFMTYTFLPLLLVWKMGWVPSPPLLWILPAMIASLMAFANPDIKQEEKGFFEGFPSYWNVYAFYAGLWFALYGPWSNAVVLLILTILTLAPVRFLYPNLSPRPWFWPVMAGAAGWLILLAMLWVNYGRPSIFMLWLSMSYPFFYFVLSIYLDFRDRTSPRKCGLPDSN